MLGDMFRAGRPVGWQHDQICSLNRHDARRFGKGTVVADIESNIDIGMRVDSEIAVTGERKAVDSQVGQMNFAIAAQNSLGGNQDCRVIDALPCLFQHPDHDGMIQFTTDFLQPVGRRARNRFRIRQCFFETGEAITGQCTFGKDGEAGTCRSSFFDFLNDTGEISLFVHERNIHLNAGNFH